MTAPILATYNGPIAGHCKPMTLVINGGMNYLKGNTKPYFSLTCWYHRTGSPRSDEGGGADHELILRLFPRFADLAALYLSDIDGVPMYAAGNGWYWYAGAKGGLGERYHGSSDRQHTTEQCAKIFRDYLRLSEVDAAALLARDMSRADLAAFCEEQRPRWEAEAKHVIAAYDLVVYGDKWEG
jgi:hypothetical protein